MAVDSRGVQADLSELPLLLRIGSRRLHIERDFAQGNDGRMANSDVLVYDAGSGFSTSPPAAYLTAGSRRWIDRSGNVCHTRPTGQPYVLVKHAGNRLVLDDKTGGLHANLYCRTSDGPLQRHRIETLSRVGAIFGGKLSPLSASDGLDILRTVNLMRAAATYQPLDTSGLPGGLLKLPDSSSIIVVGDLHSQVDNLLQVLCGGNALAAMECGNAVLLLLGDAVHSERPDQLEAMDDSLLMMDLIFRIKLAFPDRFFLLRGNHDSFAPEILKGGVPQGPLWRRRLLETRGEAYVRELQHYYDRLPLVAVSHDLAACHAGPPRQPTDRQRIIDIRRHPSLAGELVWTRLRGPGNPAGYSRIHVQRFRTGLGLHRNASVVVAHNPLSPGDVLWLDAAGIRNHHIVYSAQEDRVGTLVVQENALVPMRLPAQPLRNWINLGQTHCAAPL